MDNNIQLETAVRIPFLQEYKSLPELTLNGILSVQALCTLGHLNYHTDRIMQILLTLPVDLYGSDSTVQRISQGLYAAANANTQNGIDTFDINANTLQQFTEYIDRHLQFSHGFNYKDILKKECQQILPEEWNINNRTPMEDFCIPIKNFLHNYLYCQNPIIGVSLVLILIKRIVISQPELAKYDIDWSPLIRCISLNVIIDHIPSMINNAGVGIVNTYHQYPLLPAATADVIETSADDYSDDKLISNNN